MSVDEGEREPMASESVESEPSLSDVGDSSKVSSPAEELSEITKLQKELQDERNRNLDLSKRVMYLQADFANLQRQSERRIGEARDDTRLRFIEELISIKEDLERAMSVVKTSNSNTLFDGLRMLLSRVEGALRSEEVERISVSIGSEFDVRLHEAVAYSEGNDSKCGSVTSVISNGYTLRGKVIKPALVEVARENQNIKEGRHSEETLSKKPEDISELSNNSEKAKEPKEVA